MAENQDGQEKTEQPTGRRLGKARGEGQVAKSQEINSVAGLFAALLYFSLNGRAMIDSIKIFMQHVFDSRLETHLNVVSTFALSREMIMALSKILMPFMLLLVVIGLISNIGQFGILFTLKPLHPKFSKFNPISGLKSFVSMQKLVEILKSILKLLVIAVIPYLIIRSELEYLPLIMDTGIWNIICYIGKIILRILFYVGLVFLLLGILDLIFQKWKFKKDMMMTKEEVKDEFKQTEGDPMVKAKIRRNQIEMLRKIMLEKVPRADVVITNPVHVAVALKYDRMSMDAPQVVAKGARLIAEKIKKIARENGVPIVENKPLAQSLYKTVEVGESIPETLYKAVAEVLAYVYTRKQRTHAA